MGTIIKQEVRFIPTKNNFNRDDLYKKFAVRGNSKDYRNIFEAADYIKDSRATKASRSAIRKGIFKSSNPAARRNKYMGIQWVTTGVNIFDIDGKWLRVEEC